MDKVVLLDEDLPKTTLTARVVLEIEPVETMEQTAQSKEGQGRSVQLSTDQKTSHEPVLSSVRATF